VGPEHAYLRDQGRIEYTTASDEEAVDAFHLLAETEGILPALESAHALVEVARRSPHLSSRRILLVNLSGRGDKDLDSVLAFDRQRAGRKPEREPREPAPGPIPHGAPSAEWLTR
jgi:tryptophan synthase beta chain